MKYPPLTFLLALCLSQPISHLLGQTPAPLPSTTYEPTIPPASDNYPLGADSQKQPSHPAGSTFTFDMVQSKIFPQTVRTITVYVPAAYKGGKPACVYIGLDGLSFHLPTVFDNLIAEHAMPVTIAIGLSPGTVPSADNQDNPRFDRSFEFDTRDGRLARFLLDEVLPEVERHRTSAGDLILLSTSPDDRAIGGASTGGIGAFTAAWERPEAFHRVFLSIGTFVGMRGGEQDYVLVRKTEPKPLRIFMQDGVHDEWGGGPEMGDWWMSNQTMERALSFAGYDVRHVWGTGTHNGAQADALFPDAMRWLWRDWPAPISGRPSANPVLQAILLPGEGWKITAETCVANPSIASDPDGRVFYATGEGTDAAQIAEIGTTSHTIHCNPTQTAEPFAIGPHAKLYIAREQGGLKVSETSKVLAPALHIRNFTLRNDGDIYATVQASGLSDTSDTSDELWRITPTGQTTRLESDVQGAAGLAFSPDGLWLFVAQKRSHLGLSYRVLHDGRLNAREPFYDFAVPASKDDSAAGSIAMDSDGRAYVATSLGIQVFDRNGRVAAILPLPGNLSTNGLCFGGRNFDTLYVTAGGKIYQRKLRLHGTSPWATPEKLPPWGAG